MVSGFADTIKFEDWRGYESRVERNTLKILDVLDEYRVKATFFILGWVAERHPGIVKEIQKRGHELACHGYNHRLVYELSPEDFRKDIRTAKRIIEDISGAPIHGYRAASYSITEKSMWALDILIEEGFRYDSSIFPIFHDRYGYPGFSRFAVPHKMDGKGEILEIPLSTIRFFSKNIPIAGGGFLRLFPVRFIEWGIRSLNVKEAQPAIIYLHPWEVDEDQPRLNGGRLSSFRHHVNISKTLPKVRRLLETFRFATVKDTFTAALEINR